MADAQSNSEPVGSGVDSDLELHLAVALYLATYSEIN